MFDAPPLQRQNMLELVLLLNRIAAIFGLSNPIVQTCRLIYPLKPRFISSGEFHRRFLYLMISHVYKAQHAF